MKAALVAPIMGCAKAEVLDVNFIGAVHCLNHLVPARHEALELRLCFLIEALRCAYNDKVMLARPLNFHVSTLIVSGVVDARKIVFRWILCPKSIVMSLEFRSRVHDYEKT